MTDWQGVSLGVAIPSLVTAGLSIAAFRRAGQDRIDAIAHRAAQNQKLDNIETHVNGMNKQIEQLAYKAGGDAERENPTERKHA